MVNIIKNEDAIWHVEDYDVVLLGTNIYNMLTNGFQGKMGAKYPYLRDEVNKTNYADTRKLGTCVPVVGTPEVCLMFVCGYPSKTRNFCNYEAIESCFKYANAKYKGRKCLTTVVGSTRFDGNGDKDRLMGIIESNTGNLDLDVYDYEQLNKRDEASILFRKMLEYRYTDHDKFVNLWYDRYNVVKQLYIIW